MTKEKALEILINDAIEVYSGVSPVLLSLIIRPAFYEGYLFATKENQERIKELNRQLELVENGLKLIVESIGKNTTATAMAIETHQLKTGTARP